MQKSREVAALARGRCSPDRTQVHFCSDTACPCLALVPEGGQATDFALSYTTAFNLCSHVYKYMCVIGKVFLLLACYQQQLVLATFPHLLLHLLLAFAEDADMEDEVVLGSVRADADELAQDEEPEGACCFLCKTPNTLCCALCKPAAKKLETLAQQTPVSAGKKRLPQTSQLFTTCCTLFASVLECKHKVWQAYKLAYTDYA